MTKYEFVVAWFKQHPLTKFTNAELEQRLRADYGSKYDDEFRDPLREARKAHEKGVVQRTPKGAGQVYWYEPANRGRMSKYEFVVAWFKQHPLIKFSNAELEQRLRADYGSKYDDEFRDPLREARKAHEKGIVQRTPKGAGQVYWYKPSKKS